MIETQTPASGIVESQVTRDMGAAQKAKAIAAVAKLSGATPSAEPPALAEATPEKPQEGAKTGQESTKEAAPATGTQDKTKAEALAEIARAEAGLKRDRDRLAAEGKSLADQQKELEKYRQIQELAAKDPVAAFKALGLTPHYAAITDDILKSPEGQPDPMAVKLTALESQLAEERKARVEAEQARTLREQQAQITEIKVRFSAELDKDDRFPLLRKTQAAPAEVIWSTIVAHHRETGEAWTYAEAAQALEDQLSSLVQAATAKEEDPAGEKPPAKDAKQEPRKATPSKKPPVTKSASPQTLSNGLTPSNGGTAPPALPTKWEDRVKAVADRVKART